MRQIQRSNGLPNPMPTWNKIPTNFVDWSTLTIATFQHQKTHQQAMLHEHWTLGETIAHLFVESKMLCPSMPSHQMHNPALSFPTFLTLLNLTCFLCQECHATHDEPSTECALCTQGVPCVPWFVVSHVCCTLQPKQVIFDSSPSPFEGAPFWLNQCMLGVTLRTFLGHHSLQTKPLLLSLTSFGKFKTLHKLGTTMCKRTLFCCGFPALTNPCQSGCPSSLVQNTCACLEKTLVICKQMSFDLLWCCRDSVCH